MDGWGGFLQLNIKKNNPLFLLMSCSRFSKCYQTILMDFRRAYIYGISHVWDDECPNICFKVVCLFLSYFKYFGGSSIRHTCFFRGWGVMGFSAGSPKSQQ